MKQVTLIFSIYMGGKPSMTDQEHTRIRRVSSETADRVAPTATNGAGKGFYTHHWSDGWTACINVKRSESAKETRKASSKSKGFYGYDWMIDNILQYGQTEKPAPPKGEFRWVPAFNETIVVGDLVRFKDKEDVVVGYVQDKKWVEVSDVAFWKVEKPGKGDVVLVARRN
jgi:hypothetical protein